MAKSKAFMIKFVTLKNHAIENPTLTIIWIIFHFKHIRTRKIYAKWNY